MMFHISKLTKDMGITPRTLRFYEAMELLTDVQQGTGGKFGRVYTSEQVERIKLIRCAREAGMSVEQIRQCLHAHDAKLIVPSCLVRDLDAAASAAAKEARERKRVIAEMFVGGSDQVVVVSDD